ncbi:MAG: thioredoxin [Candidatus Woesearchaeota archaeon]
MVEELNKENFREKTKGKKAIVDFWAEWCGPCKMLGPVFEELSKDFEGKIDFFKLNVDEGGDLAQEYSVQGIPCLIVMDDGKEIDRIVGLLPKEKLKEKIESIIG